MATEALLRRFHEAAGSECDDPLDPDSLIGIFQTFRTEGQMAPGLFEGLEAGPDLESRLNGLFSAAGDGRRETGGRDAYFVVRNPPPLDPHEAERLATTWLSGIHSLAISVGDQAIAEALAPTPAVRVLEGLAPKHPKLDHEKSRLMKILTIQAPTMVERLESHAAARALRPAYYFIACDAMLRDYLMWPLYAQASGVDAPFDAYFELWRHGVKFRVFGETQVDLYLPRNLT